jgi:ribulose-5-phosphate 4-epimerase/fuculose-1-phosphate aldolase
MRKPIPALFDEQVRFLGRGVPIVSYAPSGTGLLRRNVVPKIKAGGNALILANHGALVLGSDVDKVLHNLALLEKCSKSYLMSLMTGERTRRIPLLVREIAFAQLRKEEKAEAVPVQGNGSGPRHEPSTPSAAIRMCRRSTQSSTSWWNSPCAGSAGRR